jgi:hypothetical protein
VDYTRSDDADNCGACNAPCGATNAFGASCEEGSCLYQCRRGFADCNAGSDLHDGCEQNVSEDPNSCGACGRVCATGYCHDGFCGHVIGALTGYSYYELPMGQVIGTPLALGRSVTVLAIGGALRNISQPPARARFAIYEADNVGRLSRLRAQTAAIEVTDFVAPTGPGVPRPPTLTIASIAPTEMMLGTYWIVVEADKAVRVMSESILDRSFVGESTGVEPFPASLVGDENVQTQQSDLVVYVTYSDDP